MLTVKLEHDSDIECPNTNGDGQWTLHSFGNRHVNHTDPEKFELYRNRKGELASRNRPLNRKLQNGLAFILSYYEHGNCMWSRSGHGPQCRWDNVQVAGILVWEHKADDMGAKSYEDRAKDADAFLNTYTSWANGEGLYYCIEDENGETIDSCGGFYGCDSDYMLEEIAHSLLNEEYEVEGDAADYLEDDLERIVEQKRKQRDEELLALCHS
jgi:hypothetical protein